MLAIVRARIAVLAAMRMKSWVRFLRDRFVQPNDANDVATYEMRGGQRLIVRQGTTDRLVMAEVFLERVYEPDDQVSLKRGDNVIDIGGHRGYFTVMAATSHSEINVATFEPTPESFAALMEHIKLNELSNVKPFQLAVAAEASTRALQTTRNSERNSLLLAANDAEETLVRTVTLEQALQLAGFTHCGFLKLNCEGAEFEILLGASESTLRNVDRIIVEYHESPVLPQPQVILDKFREAGFQFRHDPRRKYMWAWR